MVGIWRNALAWLPAIIIALAAPGMAQAQKVWRHGVIEPKSDAGFTLMAGERDFAAKRGLKIEFVRVKNGQIAVKALIAGELDSVESGAGEGLVAATRGADIKLVGCHWPGLPHAVFARQTVTSVKDLKGKSIAASAPGSLPELLIRGLLDKNAIPVADVKIASLGGDLDRYKALVAGVVDAAVVSSEYLPVAPKDVRILLAGRDVLPNFMRLCLYMSGKTIAQRGGEAAGFLAAEIEGFRYAFAHKDEAVKLTRATIGTKPDDPRPEFIYDQTTKRGDLDPNIAIPLDKLAWMQELFIKTGNIRTPMDLAKFVDASVRAKALELVGK